MLTFALIPVSFFPCRKIKVWDLQAALDPRAPASTLCLRTLVVCDLLGWMGYPGKLVSLCLVPCFQGIMGNFDQGI